MYGSLTVHDGVLYVGRQAKTAWVSSYDLDGRPLQTCFSFCDEEGGMSSASGMSMDDDHRLWVADQPAGLVRAFTLFGIQVACVGDPDGARALDARGVLGAPADVLALGRDEELTLVVASRGQRRHALQLFRAHEGRVQSLRPLGDPRGEFRDLAGLAQAGEWLYAAEEGAGQIQVFRSGDFHYCLPVLDGRGRRAGPVALDVLNEDTLVVAVATPASALLLLDRQGRVLKVLAHEGTRVGEVTALEDVVVEHDPGPSGTTRARLLVLDQDGTRVQVFSPQGQCYGCFPRLAGT
jgi:hypothetical protein